MRTQAAKLTPFFLMSSLSFALAASAQPVGTQPSQVKAEAAHSSAVGLDSTEVVAKVHHINQMEISMGKMAQARSKDSGVKAYGVRLVADHEKADRLLLKTAKDENFTVRAPSVGTVDQQKEHDADMTTMDELKNLTGHAFDVEFLKAMHAGHAKAIDLVSSARDSVSDGKLKQLLADMLPTLHAHEDTSAKLERRLAPASNP